MATIQIGMLGLSLAGFLLQGKGRARTWVLVMLGCALLGSLLALATLYFSPATRMRQGLIGAAPDLFNLVRMSLSNAFVFMYISLGEKAFQFVILLVISMLTGYVLYSSQRDGSKLTVTGLISALFLLPVVTYLWIVCVCAPFAYGESAYPEARVLINAMFVMVTMVMGEGLILGICLGLLHQRSNEIVPAALLTVSLLLLVVLSLFPLYSTRKVWSSLPEYQQRAQAWDEQDALIRKLSDQGQTDITVTAFQSFAGILEMGPNSNNWVNGCAALYYGVDSITAVSP
jgi:hypothetical protein